MKFKLFLIMILCSISFLYAGPNLMLDSPSIRGLGLGGAFTAVEGDVETIGVNPAGLASLTTKDAVISYFSWFEGVGFLNISGGMPLPSNIGTGAINIALFSIEDFPNYDKDGNQIGNLSASDFTITLGAGRRFNIKREINGGANLKIFSTKLGQESSLSFALDLGCQTKFNMPVLVGNKIENNLIVGLAVQNVGYGETYINESSGLPMKLRIGGNYKFCSRAGIDSSLLLELNKTAYQGFKTAIGLETGLHNLVTLRIGYKIIHKGFGNFSVGVGVGYNVGKYRLGIDYVMIPTAEFGVTNAFGLRFKF